MWQDVTGGGVALAEPPRLAAPADWAPWLRTLFPGYVRHDFAARHEALWRWVWTIEAGVAPADAFVGIWPRGGGKSTSAELASAALGCRGKRRYVLYVRDTQDRADDSVQNIAALLEKPEVARYYPEHADRQVNKYGASKGWRRNRLRTAGSFTVDAIGLDTAARGAKVEEDRPDLIILDDIDGRHDSPQTTAKKIATITSSLLPAGSEAVAVLAIQNLIHATGFFARLVTGEADYLARRIVSGPHPALVGLKTERHQDAEAGTTRDVIVAGTPTWAGQGLAKCQADIDLFGLGAFQRECQHEVFDRSDALALRFTEDAVEDITDDALRRIVRLAAARRAVFAGMDFGAWRFFFQLRVADEHGVLHQVAELFSQRESLEERARQVHALCAHYGVPNTVRIRGDAANPQDIIEINAAFRRIGSPYRVKAVRMEAKGRKAAVEKLNDLLDRGAIKYRRDVVPACAAILAAALDEPAESFTTWRLGWNASRAGVETGGSRLRWELGKWSYATPKEGEAQDQDPDDDTADGADGIAAERYAVLSYLRAGGVEEEEEEPDYGAHEGTRRIMTEHGQRMQTVRGRRQERERAQGPGLVDPMFGRY